jgi:predicted SAM-dependent methyltransferase
MRRIIVGAGDVVRDGWLSLQYSDLDIRDARQWARRFPANSLDAILTEHTLEHLTVEEARASVRNFYDYLKPGGYVRCAVPDGLHPSQEYFNWVAPNSPGEQWLQRFRGSEPPHKTLWNYHTLSKLFAEAGFGVVFREWFDEQGDFHKTEWSERDGYIRRCAGAWWSVFLSLIVDAPYTSLMIDAVKI